MTSRERVVKTLKFERPDRVPRDLWCPPGIHMYRRQELEEVLEKYPLDFTSPKYRCGTPARARGCPAIIGEYVDAWGCVWHEKMGSN